MNNTREATDSTPAVELRNVALSRDRNMILDAIDWTVQSRRHWAVIGANGSGKTTLMRIVSGWLFPSRGSVTVLGSRFGACRMADLRCRIGWVSSALESAVRPRLQALGVVLTGKDATLGIRRPPRPEDLDEAARHLDAAGVSACARRPFAILSQGEKMRVLIARALIAKPALLVLDEPCVGLDPLAREAFLTAIEELGTALEPPTILYVTHHIDEIVPCISSVLALRRGRTVAAGPKPEVLTADVLENVFDCPFTLTVDAHRYVARSVPGPNSIWARPGTGADSRGTGHCAGPTRPET